MHSRKWTEPHCGVARCNDGRFEYQVGWDRLATYEDLLLRRLRSSRVSSMNLYAADGFWNTELRLLRERGNASLIVSGQSAARDAMTSAALPVKRYQPAENVHLHVKADLFEDAGDSFFRITTAHLATRKLGPVVLGMRGFGRTELFFLTNHPGVVSEGSRLCGCLERDVLPRSGHYLRLESPLEDGIYPSLCADLRKLEPGTGSIFHCRSNYYGRMWKSRTQHLDGLVALHELLREYARRGTETWLAYGELNGATVAALIRQADAGARVGLPKYCPGSFRAPFRLARIIGRIPSLRHFKLAEHFNVTVINGIRDAASGAPYSVVYLGSKTDIPYDRATLELMVRCDSREFPDLHTGLSRLAASRLTCHTSAEFARLFPRASSLAAISS